MARFFAISFVLLFGVALVAAPASGRAPQADPPGASEDAAAQAEASRWLARSRDHLAAGESDAALASAQRAVVLAPRRPETHLMLANAYRARIAGSGGYRQLILARQIREALQAAVALETVGAEAHLALVRFHLRAPALVGGSRREAGRLAEIIVQRDPVRGALALGLLAQSEGDAELALEQFQRADLRAPAAGPLRRLVVDLLGQSLEQSGRWRAAGVLYAQSVDADPDFAEGWFGLGRVAAETGDHLPQGIAALERYLAMPHRAGQPAAEEAHYLLGSIYLQLAHADQARAQFRLALALDPEHGEAHRALEAL